MLRSVFTMFNLLLSSFDTLSLLSSILFLHTSFIFYFFFIIYFLTEVSKGSPYLFFINFILALFNLLLRGVEPEPVRCYSVALTTWLEALSLLYNLIHLAHHGLLSLHIFPCVYICWTIVYILFAL
jgi:hypothetical protein